jgi:hypothetical protein
VIPSASSYLHLAPEGELSDIAHLAPFRAVVIVDAAVTDEWRSRVSDWLVASGCSYMMAYGRSCSAWDDSVDEANCERFDFAEIPAERFVMTTWHEDESLEEVFWFCKNSARHPAIEIPRTLLLHIAARSEEASILRAYREA